MIERLKHNAAEVLAAVRTPKTIGDLIDKTDLSMESVVSAIVLLERYGLIIEVSPGRYVREEGRERMFRSKICPACQGAGVVVPPDRETDPEAEEITCPDCGGEAVQAGPEDLDYAHAGYSSTAEIKLRQKWGRGRIILLWRDSDPPPPLRGHSCLCNLMIYKYPANGPYKFDLTLVSDTIGVAHFTTPPEVVPEGEDWETWVDQKIDYLYRVVATQGVKGLGHMTWLLVPPPLVDSETEEEA